MGLPYLSYCGADAVGGGQGSLNFSDRKLTVEDVEYPQAPDSHAIVQDVRSAHLELT